MYRHMLSLLLCQAVAAAPQAISDSDITYVKLQTPIDAPTASHYRESRIENLPLTMPGNITKGVNSNLTERQPEAGSNLTDKSDVTLPESSNLSEITALPDATGLQEGIEKDLPKEQTSPETVKQDTLTEETVKPDQTLTEETVQLDQTVPEETVKSKQPLPEKTDTEKEELLEASSDLTDTLPAETYQSERRGRTYESSETTDIFDLPTERYEDITQLPEIEVPRTRPPKFIPKLSYFQKPQVFVSFPTNSLEKSARRRFRSNCRCEKIWNCPKLQISVPRCPNEYFLCCF